MDIGLLSRALSPYAMRGAPQLPGPVGRSADRLAVGEAKEASESASAGERPTGVVVELSGPGLARASRAEEESSGGAEPSGQGKLSSEDQEEVEKMRARDAEVRTHENAHKAAAGRHARGGPKFEFESGPDGRRYAVGGEVSIDASPVSKDPDATIQKMQQVRRAALAPAEPSSQDRKVAAEASKNESSARTEKLEKNRESQRGADGLGAGSAYTQSESTPHGSNLNIVA